MNLVVSNDRVASRPNLDPCECVAMDIVVLQDTSTPSEEIHAPLQPPKDLVIAEGRVTLTSDPHSGIGVGEDLVLNELTPPLCGEK